MSWEVTGTLVTGEGAEGEISTNIDGGTPAGGEVSPSGDLGDLFLVVSEQLKDEFGINWPPSKMLPYINLFVQETVNLKPEAYPVEETITLVAGARQTLPATGIALLDTLYNVSGSGTTEAVGAAVTMILKKNLDLIYPGWTVSEANATVSFIAKDEQNPKVFYTFPPQPSTSPGKVELLLSKMPAEITVGSTDIPFDDSYKPAAIDYLIYRCLIEETTVPNAQAKAASFYNKYLQDLGVKTSIERKTGARQ
jgi:hypothetical protein